MSLPQRSPLTAPDDPIQKKLESEVESMSNSLARVDGFLYHAAFDSDKMRSDFRSIAERAHRCAEILKKTP